MTDRILVKGARLLGDDAAELLLADGVVAEIGSVSDAKARVVDPTGWWPCPDSSTCTPTCASRAARTPKRCSPGRRRPRSGASRRCWRWPTPARSPTPRRPPSGCTTSAAPPGWSTCSRSRRHPRAGGEELAELGLMHRSRARVTVFSDDGRCVADARVMRRRWST